MIRKIPEELPQDGEIEEILKMELDFNIPKNKMDIHYVDYSILVDFLESLKIDASIFSSCMDDFYFIDSYFGKADVLVDVLVKKILSNSDSVYYDKLYEYLSEEDDLPEEAADMIFVFGSGTTLRTEKAIDLYKKGFAKKIMISGKGPFYKGNIKKSEAEILKKAAVKSDVPEDDIIIETESITIPDNIKRSLKLLEEKKIKHKATVLVNSPFSQHRGWAHFNKFSDGIKFIRVNSNVGEVFSHDKWYKSESGIRIILNEFIKMKGAELLNTI